MSTKTPIRHVPSTAKRSILVVEDEKALAENLRTILEEEGFGVIHAATALDATVKLRNQSFCCVVLDLNLERGTGDQVVQSMRAASTNLNHATPVVLTSGHLNRGVLEEIGPMVQHAFVKPYSMEELLQKIRALSDAHAPA
ncbi:MAG: response regulator [Bdellovibrionales bacterium]|nr:response regulator [Bdellovibrionales bacterium]